MRKELMLLRELMHKENVDVCLIPMDDFHQSEYVGDYFRTVAFVSGFTGSAGTVVVTAEEAALFTDGRYFVQAEQQLRDTGIDLMKLGEPEVPTVDAYIADRIPEGGCLCYDGRCVDFRHASELRDLLEEKNASICSMDLPGKIWQDRPALPVSPVWILAERYAGKSAAVKLQELREEMEEYGADAHILTSLDDIAWLLNLRGNDVPCNPVFLSYLLVGQDSAWLFANEADFSPEVRDYLSGLHVELRPYDGIYEAVGKQKDCSVLMEAERTNDEIFRYLDETVEVVDDILPTTLAKAVKNPVEIENMKKAHIKDGVAMVKFMYFVKHAYGEDGSLTAEAREKLGAEHFTEITASDYLERLRREQEGNLGLSFDTISAYGANAALPHYEPNREKDVEVKPRGLYLVDSGGQYYEGTTDITRTMVMGPLTEEERLHYTLVAMAMLRLEDVQFLKGCIGVNLDYTARELFWRRGLNYNHGTGHGVGYLLNVHERPNSIRYKVLSEGAENGVFQPGHITSDEPGLYIEGSHGIRTENLILCKELRKNAYGTFLGFEFLTMCPIDLDGLDLSIMEKRDLELLNSYHRSVREALSPFLSGEELEWLREATRELAG